MPESNMYKAIWKLHQQTTRWLMDYGNTSAPDTACSVDKILATADEIRNMQKPGNRKKGKK